MPHSILARPSDTEAITGLTAVELDRIIAWLRPLDYRRGRPYALPLERPQQHAEPRYECGADPVHL
jgi:hypothetical protein